MQGVALLSAVVLVITVFGRIAEYPGLTSLHLAVVAFGFAMICIPMGGGLQFMVRDRIFLGLILLTVNFVAAVPFGIFRGGSIDVLLVYWWRSGIVFLTIGAAVLTFVQFRKLMTALAISFIAISVYSIILGENQQGRITMGSGFFSNPNDLATILVVGLPICWGVIRLTLNPILKYGLLFSTGLLWIVFLRTGSRGGFIGMSIVCCLLLLHVSMIRKLQIAIATFIVAIAAVIYLPSSTLKRFVIFSENVRLAEFGEGEIDAYTSGSTDSRMEMARQGVQFTLQHPLLGLGAGNFRVASSELFKSQGLYAPWTDVHNTYLQVSSENGLPALAVYILLIAITFRRLSLLYASYRSSVSTEDGWIAESAWYLRLALCGFVISGGFGNYAYQYHLPMLMALTIALTTAESNRPPELRAPLLTGLARVPVVAAGPRRPIDRRGRGTPRQFGVQDPL